MAPPPSPTRDLCVYLGSSHGRSDRYTEQAQALGTEMARRDIGLVYGGGEVGLMGEVANAVLAAGGRATGVITRHLLDREIGNPALTELIVVDDMPERKRQMFERADGYVTLPGGVGTMEEFFEVLCWRHLGLHPKPVGLLNVDGFYDQLLGFLDHATEDGFVADNLLIVATDAHELLDRLGF